MRFCHVCTNFGFPIQRAPFENDEGYAEMFEPRYYSMRSQDLIEAKHDAGQFYLNRASSVRNDAVLINSKVKLQMLQRNNVVDIDTIEDFKLPKKSKYKKKAYSIKIGHSKMSIKLLIYI